MAHFAQLSDYVAPGVRKVLHVSAIDNAKLDPSDEEGSGIARQKRIHGAGTVWVQTSYNNTIRRRFARIDDYYVEGTGAFYVPDEMPDMRGAQWLSQ